MIDELDESGYALFGVLVFTAGTFLLVLSGSVTLLGDATLVLGTVAIVASVVTAFLGERVSAAAAGVAAIGLAVGSLGTGFVVTVSAVVTVVGGVVFFAATSRRAGLHLSTGSA